MEIYMRSVVQIDLKIKGSNGEHNSLRRDMFVLDSFKKNDTLNDKDADSAAESNFVL